MKTGITLRYGEVYVEQFKKEEDQDIPYDYIMVDESLIAGQWGKGPIRVKIFDKSMILTDIKNEGWFVCGLIDCQGFQRNGTNYLKASINVIDPKGHSSIIDTDEFNLVGIKNNHFSELIKFIFKKLNELSQYVDWSHYNEKIERDDLEKRIKILELENSELKEKLKLMNN